jgi:hypothetical protein
MLSITDRKMAFAKLGEYLDSLSNYPEITNSESNFLYKTNPELSAAYYRIQNQIIDLLGNISILNPWFTEDNIRFALKSLAESLSDDKLDDWLINYNFKSEFKPKTVGVVMAGNIPLVGFHDYLSVLISGNYLKAKLSSDDNKLLPLIHQILTLIEPGYKDKVVFTNEQLSDFDAIIATGSNNTARYFEYYFGKYPNIIRKNRNGVAVLSGEETKSDLLGLADDVFLFFGLGCRNVSKIYVPVDYDFNKLLDAFEKYSEIRLHSKYLNNYEYNKSIFLINKIKFIDNGFVILKEDRQLSSPLAVLHYEYFNDLEQLKAEIQSMSNQIQCIVSTISFSIPHNLPFGKAQKPKLQDYADSIDTIDFLLNLK